ncbi:hypothetical protein [Mycobacterium sp. 3519A]|jgi:hypothetical protein|uniref:hypothetical protein n=1 Tax=Mycobacterium sp. 3519A TaxID=2057184 RepID=UPI000C79F507|nr:hypothetical protein [Mycobacterium sp. 3519A]
MKIGVALAVCAVLIVIAGCAATVRHMGTRAPNTSLDSVEIDDSPVALPRTELVTCVQLGPNDYLFSWTGSNQLVPRRPLEETETSSQVAVDFAAETYDVRSLDLRLFFRGSNLQLHEPAEPLRLVRSGLDRYLLAGMAEDQPSEQPSLFYVRIELHCVT